ncbi:MAG: CHASE3 domain-containing protein [Gemmatimonadaceae bacterium]
MRLSLPDVAQRRLLALVPLILVILIGALTYERARSVVDDVQAAERSHQILEASGSLLTRAIDAETGLRAYLLTDDRAFLEPYHGSRTDIEKLLNALRTLVKGDQSQENRLAGIEQLVNERFALLDSSMTQRRTGRVDPAGNVAVQLRGKEKMDQLREAVAGFQGYERGFLTQRREAEDQSVSNSAFLIAAAALIAILLSALINLRFSKALEERESSNAQLKQANEDLQHQSEQLEMQAVEMESQAAELEATSEDLRSTNDALNKATLAAEASRDEAERAKVQLEQVLENLPDATSVFDSQWRWTYVNPSAARVLTQLGIDPENVRGRNVWHTLPQLKGTRFETESKRAREKGIVAEYEEYLPSLDRWMENRVVPAREGVLSFSRDITRRKREEEGAQLLVEASRVLASTLEYEKTLETVAQLAVGDLADWCGVDLVDEDGKARQVVVAHIDPDKVKWAKELNKRYPPDYDGPTGVGHVIKTGQPEIYPEISDEMIVAGARDEDHLKLMRELKFRSAIIVPMIARGHTLGALSLISTGDGRKYGEADLALAMELATRAGIAIDNAQLYRSALAASETKSAFLATMSHELRTPLNAIIGYQSLLKEGIEGPLNQGQIGQLNRIRASADHLLGLIDEVLTFSRVEAEKEVVQRETVDLHSVVNTAVTMISPLAESKGLRILVEGDDTRLFTDAGKVRQILLNLLSNAVKFSDSGEISVRSRIRGKTVEVSISDDGIGVDGANLERIFDPFWQVEQRSTRKVGGTGLGLSVSRSLARLIGGDISVESSFGKGSTFTLTLPMRQG